MPNPALKPRPPASPTPQTPDWLQQRQVMAWEPEILISGIVLFGLLQVPRVLDEILRYLNDWGAAFFLLANLDEILVAFLKTSVYLLIFGLMVNLLLRSVWVVMIGLSSTLPEGINPEKLRLQPYYADKLRRIPSYADYVAQLDKLASTVYSVTFLLFMCLIGFSFFFLVLTVTVIPLLLSIPFLQQPTHWGWLNTGINALLIFLGGTYLLDFITLGWLKRFRLYTRLYRPIYVLMSALTLAPLYRGIYYGLISRFNRWKIFAGLMVYLLAVYVVSNWQMGDDSLLNRSVMYKQTLSAATYDGYYRDKAPEKISYWLHVSSAQVSGPVLEFFIPHKAALEDSIIRYYTDRHPLSRADILASDSLILEAMAGFYRFKLNNSWLEPVPLSFMDFSRYNQRGLLGFLEIGHLPRGSYRLDLWLNERTPRQVASLRFYKTDRAETDSQQQIPDSTYSDVRTRLDLRERGQGEMN